MKKYCSDCNFFFSVFKFIFVVIYMKYTYVHCAALIAIVLYYDVTTYYIIILKYCICMAAADYMTAKYLRDAFLLLRVGGLGRFELL